MRSAALRKMAARSAKGRADHADFALRAEEMASETLDLVAQE